MPAYFVAEITRIILSVYTERRNVTPGGRLAPSLGNRKQMLSSWPSPPSSCAPDSSSVCSSQHSTHFKATQRHGLWEHTHAWCPEPGARIHKQACPQKPGLLAIKSPFCWPHLGWTACFDTQIMTEKWLPWSSKRTHPVTSHSYL